MTKTEWERYFIAQRKIFPRLAKLTLAQFKAKYLKKYPSLKQ